MSKNIERYPLADLALDLIACFPGQVIDYYFERPKPDVRHTFACPKLARFHTEFALAADNDSVMV